MINDFLSWRGQNEEFIHHLSHHGSMIFYRIYDVLRVLDYISSLKSEDIDDDMSIIFETGYAYLFGFVDEVKMYLENYFRGNLHKFLEYEELINFLLYIEEIKTSLIDDNVFNEYTKEQFDFISDDIESKLDLIKVDDLKLNDEEKANIIEDYNNRLMSVMPMDKVYKTVDEIFVDVYEAMKID